MDVESLHVNGNILQHRYQCQEAVIDTNEAKVSSNALLTTPMSLRTSPGKANIVSVIKFQVFMLNLKHGYGIKLSQLLNNKTHKHGFRLKTSKTLL